MDIKEVFDLHEVQESKAFNYILEELHSLFYLKKDKLVVYEGDNIYSTVPTENLITLMFEKGVLGESNAHLSDAEVSKIIIEEENLLEQLSELLLDFIINQKIHLLV